MAKLGDHLFLMYSFLHPASFIVYHWKKKWSILCSLSIHPWFLEFFLISIIVYFLFVFFSFDISLTLKASLMFSIYVFYIIIVGYWTLSNSKELFIWLTNGAEMWKMIFSDSQQKTFSKAQWVLDIKIYKMYSFDVTCKCS